MTFLRKLFGLNRTSQEVIPSMGGFGVTGLDEYYAVLREDRPYVIAMREVAADGFRFG